MGGGEGAPRRLSLRSPPSGSDTPAGGKPGAGPGAAARPVRPRSQREIEGGGVRKGKSNLAGRGSPRRRAGRRPGCGR